MKERGNRILRFADRWLGIPTIALLGALSKRRAVPEAIDVVGILMFGVIGDTIFAASLARAIKMWRPNVTVVALVAKSNAGAIDLVDGIDEVMIVPVGRPLKAIKVIRGRKFDVLMRGRLSEPGLRVSEARRKLHGENQRRQCPGAATGHVDRRPLPTVGGGRGDFRESMHA